MTASRDGENSNWETLNSNVKGLIRIERLVEFLEYLIETFSSSSILHTIAFPAMVRLIYRSEHHLTEYYNCYFY